MRPIVENCNFLGTGIWSEMVPTQRSRAGGRASLASSPVTGRGRGLKSRVPLIHPGRERPRVQQATELLALGKGFLDMPLKLLKPHRLEPDCPQPALDEVDEFAAAVDHRIPSIFRHATHVTRALSVVPSLGFGAWGLAPIPHEETWGWSR